MLTFSPNSSGARRKVRSPASQGVAARMMCVSEHIEEVTTKDEIWRARPVNSRLVGIVVARDGMPSIVEQRRRLTAFGVPIAGFRHPAPNVAESWEERLDRLFGGWIGATSSSSRAPMSSGAMPPRKSRRSPSSASGASSSRCSATTRPCADQLSTQATSVADRAPSVRSMSTSMHVCSPSCFSNVTVWSPVELSSDVTRSSS